MVTQMTLSGETVLQVNGTTLIASKSQPGGWHQTTTEQCDCLGFHYRSDCRHVRTLRTAEAERTARIARNISDIWGD